MSPERYIPENHSSLDMLVDSVLKRNGELPVKANSTIYKHMNEYFNYPSLKDKEMQRFMNKIYHILSNKEYFISMIYDSKHAFGKCGLKTFVRNLRTNFELLDTNNKVKEHHTLNVMKLYYAIEDHRSTFFKRFMNRRRPTDILIRYMQDCDIDLVVFLASKTYSNTLKPYLYECFLLTLYYDMPELFEKGTEEHTHPDTSKNSKHVDKNGRRA